MLGARLRVARAAGVAIVAGALAACGGDTGGPTGERISISRDTLTGAPPIIIAHRGASGLYPEHTLQAYEVAIDQGADFIEPDLVMTRDGVLVARHERTLSVSTDVASRPEFADRKTLKQVGGRPREDWFVEDFSLSELKSLRAIQTRRGRATEYDGQFAIPTFTEILGLVAITNQTGQRLGVYPELKDPSYFASIGLDMRTAVLDALETADLRALNAPVYLQSFEPGVLQTIAETADWPLIQLLPAQSATEPTLQEIAEYADGIGPSKRLLTGYADGPSAYVSRAHSEGLLVHPYTYRNDALPDGFTHIQDELNAAFAAGVDGVFVDFPATGVSVRDSRT
ncbi:MAG: glycerophosphodiester phosphodiesterase family protein [Pseudomonadota bacterium]